MSDERGRSTERRQEQQPDITVEASVMQNRIRRGELDLECVQLAARLGSQVAQNLSPNTKPVKNPIKHIFGLDATHESLVALIPSAIIHEIYATIRSRMSLVESSDEDCYEIDGCVVDQDFLHALKWFCEEKTLLTIDHLQTVADHGVSFRHHEHLDDVEIPRNNLVRLAVRVVCGSIHWLQIVHRSRSACSSLSSEQQATLSSYRSYLAAKHKTSEKAADKLVRAHLLEIVIGALLA